MPKINLLKMPDPAARTAKFVNMMNATKRQEAEERQATIAQQRLDLETKEDVREEAQQKPTITKMEQDNLVQALSIFREGVTDIAEGDVAAAEALRADLVSRVPGYDKFILPASQWTPEYKFQLKTTAEQEIQKTIATPTTETIFGPKNEILELTKGGAPGVAGLRPVLNKPAAGATPTAPPRTPVVPTAAPQQTTPGPIPVGKYGEDRVIPDNAVPLTDFEREDIRRIKEGSGMTNTPASFTRGGMGQMSPDMVPALIDSAVKTGVMAQIDLDQMLALAPPQARQGIVDVLRSNNVSLQADAPSLVASGMNQQQPMAPNPVGRQQSTYADMRGLAPRASFADLGSAPPVQTTRAQTNVMGQQAYGRSASPTSPIPGSAQVPLPRLGAEKRVEAQASKGVELEMAPQIAAATARATATVETEKKAAEKLLGSKQVSTLIKKVRAAYEALNKAEAIPSETRGGFANAMDYFGTSSLGREAQKMVGTTSSKYLSEIINSRKLLATAIKNATGMSAQEMNSNVELQLTLDALTDPTQGIEAARTTLNTLEELYGAPRTAAPAAAAPRAAPKTPVIPKAAIEMLRKNPSPKQGAMFDRVFGKGAAAKVLGQR